MAVQTHQQPSNFSSSYEEMNPSAFGVMDESASIFLSNIGDAIHQDDNAVEKILFGCSTDNYRKRGREMAVSNNGANQFAIKSQPSIPRPRKIRRFGHLPQGRQLTIDVGEQNLRQSVNQNNPALSTSCSSLLGEDFASPIENYNREVKQILHTQAEQLRQALFQRQQSHYNQLLLAAEKSATQTLKTKSNQTEIDLLVRRNIELEDQLNRLQTESLAWQSKAAADSAAADSIHAQIQRVMARAEDVGSSCIESERETRLLCKLCRNRTVSVVVLPCRHLCLCEECDVRGIEESCPVCNCVGSGSVRVFL